MPIIRTVFLNLKMKYIYYCIILVIHNSVYGQNNKFYNYKMEYKMYLNFDNYKEYSAVLFFNKNQSYFEYKTDQKKLDESLKQDQDNDQKFTFHVTDTSAFYIKSNKSENTVIQLERGFKDEKYLLVKEKIPQIKWKITDSTKVINNYECFKAEGSFAGRNYSVWFAPELPAFFGPWKFHGLPGAVLEVNDELKEIRFISTKIKHVNQPIIHNHDIRHRKVISRKDYIKSLNEFVENLESKINTKAERGFRVKIKAPKYNTIEIYEN